MQPPSAVPVRSKLPAAGTTIFSVMSALAQKHGAVNLGQGFPDYPIDATLIDLVAAAMRAGHNQYPLYARRSLREAIAAKVLRLYGRRYDPVDEITVTTGATQAIFTTIQALSRTPATKSSSSSRPTTATSPRCCSRAQPRCRCR